MSLLALETLFSTLFCPASLLARDQLRGGGYFVSCILAGGGAEICLRRKSG
jgi:hypothetical protein